MLGLWDSVFFGPFFDLLAGRLSNRPRFFLDLHLRCLRSDSGSELDGSCGIPDSSDGCVGVGPFLLVGGFFGSFSCRAGPANGFSSAIVPFSEMDFSGVSCAGREWWIREWSSTDGLLHS